MSALENMTAEELEARLQVLAWNTPQSEERTAEIQRIVARLEELPCSCGKCECDASLVEIRESERC